MIAHNISNLILPITESLLKYRAYVHHTKYKACHSSMSSIESILLGVLLLLELGRRKPELEDLLQGDMTPLCIPGGAMPYVASRFKTQEAARRLLLNAQWPHTKGSVHPA